MRHAARPKSTGYYRRCGLARTIHDEEGAVHKHGSDVVANGAAAGCVVNVIPPQRIPCASARGIETRGLSQGSALYMRGSTNRCALSARR